MNDLISIFRILVVSAIVALVTYRVVPAPRAAAARVIDSVPTAEMARVGRDLLVAEQSLRERDVTGLTESQRANRARVIELLKGYRERGQFPTVEELPSHRAAQFRDSRGRLDAVSFLLAQTGRPDLASRLADTRNSTPLRDLPDEPELRAWAVEHGITMDELADLHVTFDYLAPKKPSPSVPGVTTSTTARRPHESPIRHGLRTIRRDVVRT